MRGRARWYSSGEPCCKSFARTEAADRRGGLLFGAGIASSISKARAAKKGVKMARHGTNCRVCIARVYENDEMICIVVLYRYSVCKSSYLHLTFTLSTINSILIIIWRRSSP